MSTSVFIKPPSWCLTVGAGQSPVGPMPLHEACGWGLPSSARKLGSTGRSRCAGPCASDAAQEQFTAQGQPWGHGCW